MVGIYHRFTCSEGFSQVEGYQAAINDKENMWHCHHRLETHYYDTPTGRWVERDDFLSEEDLRNIGKYDNVPAFELIFLPIKEHLLLHKSGKHNSMAGKITKGAWQKGHVPYNRDITLLICNETNEVKSSREWKELGYSHCVAVANGKRNVCHGKTFTFYKEQGENK